jgi:regulator of replication initiation timing
LRELDTDKLELTIMPKQKLDAMTEAVYELQKSVLTVTQMISESRLQNLSLQQRLDTLTERLTQTPCQQEPHSDQTQAAKQRADTPDTETARVCSPTPTSLPFIAALTMFLTKHCRKARHK